MRVAVGICALLAGVESLAQPVITPGGVVNAASYARAGFVDSSIAQGSIFVAYGSNLGPGSLVNTGFPLSTTLAGTSASVTVGGVSVSPLMVYTSANAVAMLMPSSTPAGSGTITITYNGQSSSPVPVEVSPANFGIFAVSEAGTGPAVVTDAADQLITLTHAAKPGQVLVLWGTGLGPVSGDESHSPTAGNVGPEPAVWVGSQKATLSYWGRSPCCAGLDQIDFEVPAGVTGCWVPVAVQTATSISNFGTIAVDANSNTCSGFSPLGPSGLSRIAGGLNLNVARLSLSRSIVSTTAPGSQQPTNTTTDSGYASFLSYTPAQLLSSSFDKAVSVGYCTVVPVNADGVFTDPVQPVGLDAGLIEVGGVNGTVELQHTQSKGIYSSTFGTSSDGKPMFLDAPQHTFNVFGGADIGVFAQEVHMPAELVWLNENDVSDVSQSQGLTINWTNATPKGVVMVSGHSLSADQAGQLGSGMSFVCLIDAGPEGSGQFTVPAFVLSALPLTANPNTQPPGGTLGISSFQSPSDPLTGVRGIDVGVVQTSLSIIKNVNYGE